MKPIRPHPGHPSLRIDKIRMRTSLLRRDSASGIIHQQRLEQIQAILAQNLNALGIDDLILLFALPLGEAGLEIRETRHAGPLLFRRRAQHAENLEDLVDLAVAREQRLLRRHLRENAPHAPHVHAGAVLSAAEQDLWRAVPQRDDFVGVGAQGDAEGAREPEVGEFEVAGAVDEEVLGFQVAVEDAVGVAVAYAEEELVGEFLDLRVYMLEGCWHLARRCVERTIASPSPMWPCLPSMTPSGNGFPLPPCETGRASMYFFRSRSKNSKTR